MQNKYGVEKDKVRSIAEDGLISILISSDLGCITKKPNPDIAIVLLVSLGFDHCFDPAANLGGGTLLFPNIHMG